jgi:hypothetical protein
MGLMPTTFQRKVSPLERIFILLAKIDTPFSNQIVLEGTGELDVARWRKAVQAAGDANPGSRLIYRGRSSWAKWVDCGVAAPVRSVDGTGWTGDRPDGAPFLFEPLPFCSTHSCEVVLIHGHPPRVAFRTLHAAMDGSGTLLWVYDIFRALRGEPLIGSSSTLTDVELIVSKKYPVRWERKPRKCLAPTGSMEDQAPGYTWRRTQLRGRFSKLLPKAALLIAQQTRKQGPTHVCFNIPIDLRRRIPGAPSTANMTRRVVLHAPPEATVDTLQQQLTAELDQLRGDPKILKFLSYAPLGWIERVFKFLRTRNLHSGHYRSTGSISNLGRIEMELLRGGGFETQTGFFVPPGTEAKPFFMTLSGWGDCVEMVVSMPNGLASHGRLEEFIANLALGLKTSP